MASNEFEVVIFKCQLPQHDKPLFKPPEVETTILLGAYLMTRIHFIIITF